MKTIQVVAAIIRDGDKILATKRGYGELAGGWEFPGGKVELGESDEVALVREIKEELELTILVEEFIHTVEYDYPNFHLHMNCYFAKVQNGEMVLTEHQAAKWLTKDTLMSVNWLPADVSLIEILQKLI